ncbi:hypothetical protein FC83_GL000968 [Agrilactobacillus composti DSM 18527 = JCM 14202]|uniref:Uncharacterized protein n=1 Tax=Agrilactobacillus composti DSM 18527 = JCM 14202 TaxID=1423734 RepID=X0PU79_9LACO|nr:hypothetical protein [Agrilactobacillus composti]KRM35570.1 hypothetical protein FC83_GL000968 [Agrilactobacillus composti DSM 18527 = JCM 14202]GAF41627.1 hypothetical protein JCM14202_3582 [Agrilactobacillus composti DSM 18527 = JCM 14202]
MQNKKDKRALKRVWQHSLFNNPENSFLRQWWFWLLIIIGIGTIFFTGQTVYDYFGLSAMVFALILLISLVNILSRYLRHKIVGMGLIALAGISLIITVVTSLITYKIGI